jgi:hypothetical protein
VTGGHAHGATSVGAEREVAKSMRYGRSGTGRRTASYTSWVGSIDRRAKVRVLTECREREFVCVRLADEDGASVEQSLHRRRGHGLGTRHREQMRVAATGRVTGDVKQIFDGESEAGEGAD